MARYTITVQLEAPAGQGQGIKEDLAMYLEQYGPCRVMEVKETKQPRQNALW